jgi:putative peptidoglycan lipid II flippase
MQFLAHAGIALATAIAAWLNAIALGVVLLRRGHLSFDDRLRRRTPRIVAAAVLMGAVVYAGVEGLAGPLAGTEAARIPALVALVVAGLGAFVIFARLLGAFRFNDIQAAFSKN